MSEEKQPWCWLCLLLLRPPILGSKPSFASIVLLRACRPALVVDPILYVPATRAERSLLVRWRIGWLPGKPEDCPCGRDRRSRRHFLECDLILSFLWSDLPRCPPGSYPIDFALSSLPLGRSACCPPWWSSLLLMLWHIQRLCRPNGFYPIEEQ
ncbi:hypothetical protein G6F56_011167 [Rhizopus delemar]|nr:hypothetical protein G6F56_011167 [Rhizopus delemar]